MKKLLLYLFAMVTFSGCYSPEDTLDYLYENKKTELEDMVEYVRKVPSIKDIIVYENNCTTINRWRKCHPDNTPWLYYTFPEEGSYVNTKKEVLEREGIDDAVFTYITGKMKKWKINELRKTDEYIDFRITLFALRYYFDPEHEELKEDTEYLAVDVLDKHWCLYYVDWN